MTWFLMCMATLVGGYFIYGAFIEKVFGVNEKRQTRGGARVFRYGGEEFTILFNGKKTQDCIEYLDELRQEIANYDLLLRNPALRLEDDIEGMKQRKTKRTNKPVKVLSVLV